MSAPVVSKEYIFADHLCMMRILGSTGEYLAIIADEAEVKVGQRGDSVIVKGEEERVESTLLLLDELYSLAKDGKTLQGVDIKRSARILKSNPSAKLKKIFNDVVHVTSEKRLITPKGLAQKIYVDAIRSNDLTFGIGPAGTGKTYLAVALGVSELLAGRYKRIILTRPAVEAGEKLGFLPGDMVEKINPYVRPLYDALNDMMDGGKTADLIAYGQIEIAPLAFMRGRTLNDSFVILDEAQNTTKAQMKMFLTRLGYSSKAVVTGDITQMDLPRGEVSGLYDAQNVLKDIEGIAFCSFSQVDVVRHELVQKIIAAYEKSSVQNSDQGKKKDSNLL
ncbi:MAG: PhoH family protein [Deltaproteobacteria bacterium]|nr:PhoH family protein [Deltaproteobacteria bacterium]